MEFVNRSVNCTSIFKLCGGLCRLLLFALSKVLYIKRESGLRLELIAQATNLLNHTNFSSVNNIFPNTFFVDPLTNTPSAVVTTASGTKVDLLHGPYRFKGFVPTSAAQLTTPLAFRSANPPRQISFGLQLAF